MSLTDLEIRTHTKPLEKELDHQKEQKAKWKNIAYELQKALFAYQSENKLDTEKECKLFDGGVKALKLFADEKDK